MAEWFIFGAIVVIGWLILTHLSALDDRLFSLWTKKRGTTHRAEAAEFPVAPLKGKGPGSFERRAQ
jgi:hypothetical protein